LHRTLENDIDLNEEEDLDHNDHNISSIKKDKFNVNLNLKGISSIAKYNEDTDRSLDASPKPGFNMNKSYDSDVGEDGEIPDEIPRLAKSHQLHTSSTVNLLGSKLMKSTKKMKTSKSAARLQS
jgi:hypothetical protein